VNCRDRRQVLREDPPDPDVEIAAAAEQVAQPLRQALEGRIRIEQADVGRAEAEARIKRVEDSETRLIRLAEPTVDTNESVVTVRYTILAERKADKALIHEIYFST
jgi:hypothetical protein